MHSFKGWQNNKNHAFRSKRCASNDKMCYCYTLTTKIIRTYLYITCNKIIFLLKNILAYYGYSPISPFLLLLSEHKHCDKAATNSNSENARSRIVASLRESWVRGERKMSQVMGAFGLLDSTMLRPVLAWRAFLNLLTVYLFNFPIFFRTAVIRR